MSRIHRRALVATGAAFALAPAIVREATGSEPLVFSWIKYDAYNSDSMRFAKTARTPKRLVFSVFGIVHDETSLISSGGASRFRCLDIV